MAESADALDSGSSGSNTVCVQVTLSAPAGSPRRQKSFRKNTGAFFFAVFQKNLFSIQIQNNVERSRSVFTKINFFRHIKLYVKHTYMRDYNE